MRDGKAISNLEWSLLVKTNKVVLTFCLFYLEMFSIMI